METMDALVPNVCSLVTSVPVSSLTSAAFSEVAEAADPVQRVADVAQKRL